MPVNYRYNSVERLIEIRCSGQLVIEEIVQYFAAVANDERVEPGAVELVDLSRVTYLDVDFKEVATMPESYAPAREAQRFRGTILFGVNEINGGLAQLMRAHFNHSLPDHRFIVCDGEEAARAEARRLVARPR